MVVPQLAVPRRARSRVEGVAAHPTVAGVPCPGDDPPPRPGRGGPAGPRRGARLLGLVLGPVLLLGPLLAACGAGAGPATRTPVGTAVASAADCLAPQVLGSLGFDPAAYARGAHPSAPAAGPLPEGFAAVSAVRCSTGETLTDQSGRWAAVTASRLEGDVAPLVDALAAPARATATAPVPGAAPTGCPAGAERTDLWLVDALGDAVRVALPGGGCDPLPDAVADGLAALDAVDVEHYPVALVEPRPAASTGPTD
jgi:hypothetical protein